MPPSVVKEDSVSVASALPSAVPHLMIACPMKFVIRFVFQSKNIGFSTYLTKLSRVKEVNEP